MSAKLVSIDQQGNGDILVQSMSQTVNLLWISNGLPTLMRAGFNSMQLGAAVLSSLKNSEEGVPSRDVVNDPPDREFLDFVGVDSYAKYMRGVRSVSVRSDKKMRTLMVTPEVNEGGRGGFTPMVDERFEIQNTSPLVVGEAVLKGLSIATA